MKYEITKQKYFTSNELRDIRSCIDSLVLKYEAFFLLLMYTGARVSEILNLDYRHIPLDCKTIPIKGLKGSRDRDIFLPPHVASVISRYLYERMNRDVEGSSDKDPLCRLFPWSYRRAVQVWEDIRPVVKPLKAFRHSFAINLYKKTKDVFVVQTALGHASFTSTQVYLEHLMREQSLKKLSNIDLYGRDDD